MKKPAILPDFSDKFHSFSWFLGNLGKSGEDIHGAPGALGAAVKPLRATELKRVLPRSKTTRKVSCKLPETLLGRPSSGWRVDRPQRALGHLGTAAL